MQFNLYDVTCELYLPKHNFKWNILLIKFMQIQIKIV